MANFVRRLLIAAVLSIPMIYIFKLAVALNRAAM
jgi:hypothetical protein